MITSTAVAVGLGAWMLRGDRGEAADETRAEVVPSMRVDERPAPAATPAMRVTERMVVPDREPAPSSADEPPPSPSPREHAKQLDIMFRGESIDAVWASQARYRLETSLASLIPRSSQVRSLECRASFCRFEMVHQDLSTYREFLERAFLDTSHSLGEGPTFTTLLDEPGDGPVVAVSYLARAGRELPHLE